MNKTRQDFIQQAKAIHSDFYDYSLLPLSGFSSRLSIVCPVHGTFSVMGCWHITKERLGRCPHCVVDEKRRKFLDKSTAIFGKGKYDYSLIDFSNTLYSELSIICPTHGIFVVSGGRHFKQRQGCPLCREEAAQKYRERRRKEKKEEDEKRKLYPLFLKDIGMRYCSRCGQLKEENEFRIIVKGPGAGKFWNHCNSCEKEHKHERWEQMSGERKARKYKRSLQNIKRKYRSDENFRILKLARGRVRSLLKNNKRNRTVELIGIDGAGLLSYLQGLGYRDSHHIDHYIPPSRFDLRDNRVQKVLLNYRNLRPLEGVLNMQKRDKLPHNWKTALRYLCEEVGEDFDFVMSARRS